MPLPLYAANLIPEAIASWDDADVIHGLAARVFILDHSANTNDGDNHVSVAGGLPGIREEEGPDCSEDE